jgi:hypothetical protein
VLLLLVEYALDQLDVNEWHLMDLTFAVYEKVVES